MLLERVEQWTPCTRLAPSTVIDLWPLLLHFYLHPLSRLFWSKYQSLIYFIHIQKEMGFKTMRISMKWQILKIMVMHSVGVAAVKWTFCYASGGSISWRKFSGRQFGTGYDKNLKVCIPFCLMILLMGIYLKEIIAMCTYVYLQGCSLKCYLW